MNKLQNIIGLEINPKYVGALFTERVEKTLRIFCFYTHGGTSQFDVPAEDNLDKLHHFFSRLNMDATCSSLIINEVVQGRVYARSEEEHWLYTLLSAPGNRLPTFNADICQLPWRLCWRSSEADILEYGKTGDSVHCFAIRTQVSESDSLRLVKDSKAFINPVSIAKKQLNRWIYFNVIIVLACLAILIGMTLAYTFKENNTKSADASLPEISIKTNAAVNYYLLYNHKISGPYSEKSIAEMSSGGLLNESTMCRAENSTDWISLTKLVPPTTAP